MKRMKCVGGLQSVEVRLRELCAWGEGGVKRSGRHGVEGGKGERRERGGERFEGTRGKRREGVEGRARKKKGREEDGGGYLLEHPSSPCSVFLSELSSHEKKRLTNIGKKASVFD